MGDSPNHTTPEDAEDIQFFHINKTEDELSDELQENQSGIATDTKRLVFRNGTIYRVISEDANRNVAIGDITATEKLHVDGNIKAIGSFIASNIITDAADGNRMVVANQDAYAGTDPTPLLAPVELTDNILMPTGSKIRLVPPYLGRANYAWSGVLYLSGNIDYGDGNHYPTYYGEFNLFWTKQAGTEIIQGIEAIFNKSTNIGLSESAKDFNVFGSNEGYATNSCWVGLQNASGYDIRVFYYFRGGLQPAV